MRCRVAITWSAERGPTASGVIERLPSPAMSTGAALSSGGSSVSMSAASTRTLRKRLFLAPRKRLERQGKIAAAGLSEQPRGPFGRDLGLVDVQTLALIFALADAGKLVPAAQIFQQLDRKIGPVCHKITPFRGVCGGMKKICIFLEKMLAIFEV